MSRKSKVEGRKWVGLLLLFAAGCAHRYPLVDGAAREAVAGLPLSFGAAEPLPSGTRVRWEFGDGAACEGANVSHAFARAGEYRVRQLVSDDRGERERAVSVRVARRPPAAAVPPDATAVLVLDRIAGRLPALLGLAERLAGPDVVADFVEAAEQTLGFAPTRSEAVLQAGFDPDEGLAFAKLPGDSGAWLVVGTWDDRTALNTAQLALARETRAIFRPQDDGSLRAEFGSEQIHLFVHGGYLFARWANLEDGAPDFKRFTSAPAEGLYADSEFAKLRAALQGEDAFSFGRAQELPRAEGSIELSAIRAGAGATAAAARVGESELAVDLLVTLDAEAKRALAKALGGGSRSSLSRRAPPGAIGYLGLSLAPPVLRHVFEKIGERVGEGDAERAARGLSELGPVLDGELAAAFYFDFAGLIDDLARQRTPGPGVELLAAAGLTDASAGSQFLTGLATRLDARQTGQAPVRIELQGRKRPGAVALEDALLFGSGELLDAALTPGELRRLDADLREALPPQAFEAGHQVLWVNVAGVIDSLRNPPRTRGFDRARSKMLAGLALMAVERRPELRPLLSIRDLLIDAWPSAGGLSGRVRLRLR